jgi:hypothetical protein
MHKNVFFTFSGSKKPVKLAGKILSIFVSFLENMNLTFQNETFTFVITSVYTAHYNDLNEFSLECLEYVRINFD